MKRRAFGGDVWVLAAMCILHVFVPGSCGRELVRSFRDEGSFRPQAFSADDRLIAGRFLMVGGMDASVLVREVVSGKEVAQLPVEDELAGIAFLPSGTTLVLCDIPRGSVTQWDFKSGEVHSVVINPAESERSGPDRISVARVSPEGKMVALSGQ